MPNHVYNKLQVISNDTKEIKKFIDNYMTENDGEFWFDFNKIIPEPATKEICEKEYPEYLIKNEEDAKEHCLSWTEERNWFNWYDWHCRFWGTKWNAYDQRVEKIKTVLVGTCLCQCLTIYFCTAWGPVVELINKMITQCNYEKDIDVLFKYSFEEEMADFAGQLEWNVVRHEYELIEANADNPAEMKRIDQEEDFGLYWEDEVEEEDD